MASKSVIWVVIAKELILLPRVKLLCYIPYFNMNKHNLESFGLFLKWGTTLLTQFHPQRFL